MRGESIISTTGARDALAGANAAALQGQASIGGGAAQAMPAAHHGADTKAATTAAILNRNCRMVGAITINQEKKPWALMLPKAVW